MAKRHTSAPPPVDRWRDQLNAGLVATKLELAAKQKDQLLEFLGLLLKWNRAYNLTAVRDPREMVSRQLLDSLSILPWIQGPRVLDVGTGAGLPGIPLAIALPHYEFTLLDSNGKKTRFLQQVTHSLGLKNVRVVQQRVEQMNDAQGFDTITTRAFAELHRMIEWTAHLRSPGGRWLAMKSGLEEFSPEQLPGDLEWQIASLKVPGERAQRNLVVIGPIAGAADGQADEGGL